MLSNSTLAWALTEWLSVGSLTLNLCSGLQNVSIALLRLAHSSSESEGGTKSTSMVFALLVAFVLFLLLATGFVGNLIWAAGRFCDNFLKSFCGGNFFRGAPDVRLFTFDSSILWYYQAIDESATRALPSLC